MKRLIYLSPFSLLLIAALVVILILMIPLLFLGLIRSAFSKLGFGLAGIILILVATIAGSFFNIPVMRIKSAPEVVRVPHGRLMDYRYRPQFSGGITIIAVNIGGAVVPVLVSAYLLTRVFIFQEGSGILLSSLAGILIVPAVSYLVAKPVQGVGVGIPILIPPLSALICGLVRSFGISGAAPVIAYVSGALGTLIGADLLNLRKMCSVGADMVSIGGAGTFDGIFLTGIIAALLA
ncbi:DUF1614 domain-containing protein [Methanolacinia petrolearia]|uniref:DUF1614 domain-containing protein n=1 Tax=Methanolacinia petrolearia TaxID=54120 RepID=UPI003BA95F05